jgi:hypothetical protein
MALLTGIGIGTTVALLAGFLVAPASLRWPCLAMAVVLGPGTLYAMQRLQSGAGEQAVYGLVATWGLMMAITGGWLLPALEPFRLTQLVAARLGEITRSVEATPLMAGYKPPGIVWELGRPVPTFEGRDELAAMVREQPVAAALSEPELKLVKSDPRLALDLKGTVTGFDVEHARQTTLQMVVIRPSGGAEVARRPALQKPRVE